MFNQILFWICRRLLKGYHIFVIIHGEAFFMNDIMIDSELKEIVLQYIEQEVE